MVRKFLQYLKGWRGIVLISYMWLILMGYVIVYVNVSSPEVKKRFYIVSVAECLLIALIYFCPKLLRYAERLKISTDDPVFTKREAARFFLRTWMLSFGVFFVMYMIFFPGGFNEDAIYMYSQAVGLSKYNDWHPVINTLFSYKLPLVITNYWKGAPVLFQTIIFSLSLAYMALTLFEYGNYTYAKRFLIYIMLNPATLSIYLSSQKDSSFSIAMMLLMTFGVRVYFTKGAWLRNIKNMILYDTVHNNTDCRYTLQA